MAFLGNNWRRDMTAFGSAERQSGMEDNDKVE